MPVWLEVSRYGGDENDQDISEMDELTYSPKKGSGLLLTLAQN